jgi:chemotaxis protein histidine kinase CheA
MSAELEDGFQKELIEVFVQEAREWLQQIHVALDELQQGPDHDRHLELARTIKAGITNMGGSAATIGLSEVERASFAAFPFIEAVENHADKISADDFIALCKQLGHIHSALTHSTGATFEAEAASEQAGGLPVTVPTSELLTLLYEFRAQQAQLGSHPRNLLETVIAQVEGLNSKGVERCNVTSLKEFLERWSDGEDVFLESVRKQIPAIADEINRLKTGVEGSGQSSERIQGLLEKAAQLWSAAQQVNAAQTMTFFMGLHSFLTMVMQRRVVVAADRYAAVESRLMENERLLQNWVEAGRTERAAIGGILPA